MSETAPAITDSDYEQSAELSQFAEALAAAQGEIDNAEKGAANPHFKSRYADLADVINACRVPLAKNKIARVQVPRTRNGEVGVRTQLIHASGQYIAFTFWCAPERPGPQPLGSVLTYLRRYGLAAAVGVGQEEDDGNAGQGQGEPPRDWNREPPKGQQRAQNGNGAPPPVAPADPEHEANLKKIRDCVGNELKLEAHEAKEMLRTLFGVESTTQLSKERAKIMLQLVLARTDGDKAYQEAKAKAIKDQPGLFAPQKGAAA